jgi:protein-S-isoprenylcysteine O-methyltransferase Ste14
MKLKSRLASLFGAIVTLAVIGLLIFISAGTLALPWVWLYLAAAVAVTSAGVFFISPELLAERNRPGPGAERDRLFIAGSAVLWLAYYPLAGLDVGRWRLTSLLPAWLMILGFVGCVASMAWIIWSMAANKFLSTLIRIQRERGHTLATGGPYRYVRHPAYAGAILFGICGALAMGSLLAALPMLVWAVLLAQRAVREEALLKTQLAGYSTYMQTVRFRLIPGVW